ncbi:hypothetical protein DP44_5694 [Burkholderia pseudomallei]|nr:hypothetical protein DP44_5694 [Burkholderia pseudomallei]
MSRRTELHRPALVVVVPAPLRAYDFSGLSTVGSRASSHTAQRWCGGIQGVVSPRTYCCQWELPLYRAIALSDLHHGGQPVRYCKGWLPSCCIAGPLVAAPATQMMLAC